MTAFSLKLIALASMIIDHAGVVLHPMLGFATATNQLRVAGRLAFPIFVYLLADGFRHTKSPWRFTARLGLFAIISEPVFSIAFHGYVNFFANTNIFYTLAIAGAAISAAKTVKISADAQGLLACAFALPAMGLAPLLSTDYGAYGVAFIIFMYVIRHVKARLAAMAALCVYQFSGILELAWRGYGAFVAPVAWAMIPATLAAVVLAALYNGKRGRDMKWAFYAAYPAHLAVIALIARAAH